MPGRKEPSWTSKGLRRARSSVRAAAIQALGALKDKRLAAFFKDLFRKDKSNHVRAEALRALGLVGVASLIPLLREATSVLSHQNLSRCAAEKVLKQIEK